MKEKKEKTKEEKQDDRREILWVSSIISVVMLINTVNICGKIKRARLAKESKTSAKTVSTAISNNDNIDEKEIKYLDNIKSFFNDYEKYIDVKLAFERLEKFDIIYKESKENSPIITGGSWSSKDNNITYYITAKDNEEERKNVISHELLHLVSTHDSYYPKVLSEGITSVISKEYGFGDDSYNKYRLITYMLCEVVSSDTVIESYLKGDFSIIEKKLNEIDPSKELCNKLKENLDNYYDYDSMVISYYGRDLDELEDCMYLSHVSMRDECIENIADTLYGYYVKKNGNVDEKMDIYNAELRKDYVTKTEDYRNKKTKYIPTDEFKVTTSYFNKRNKEDIKSTDKEEDKTLIKK